MIDFLFEDYVLQRALTVADQDQKDLLVSKIRPQLVSMRRYSSAYSKHLISSMSSIISSRDLSSLILQSSASWSARSMLRRRRQTNRQTTLLYLKTRQINDTHPFVRES